MRRYVYLIFLILLVSSCGGSRFPFDQPENEYYEDLQDFETETDGQPEYDPGDSYVPEPDYYSYNDPNTPNNTISTSSPSRITYSIKGCVNSSAGLNIRSGPGTSYSRIGTLKYDDCISLTGRNEDGSWGKISSGWVKISFLNITENVTNLPISSYTSNEQDDTVNTYICDCSGNIYNCKDFSGSDAQRCYEYCLSLGVGDIHYLDADGDGLACEPYP